MKVQSCFWKKIKELRNRRWISQEKLWQLSWIHRTYISEIERGIANITLDHIYKLALALQIPLPDLFKF